MMAPAAMAGECLGRTSIVSQISTWHPRVFVGAPTGSLNPQIPSPVYRPSAVAIEIADGIGFGIDGETLIVDDGGKNGTVSITGHLDDGTYPQRDFTVTRNGDDTKIDGYFGWQTYAMHRDKNVLHINGEDDTESSTVTKTVDGTVVDGAWPAQRFYLGQAQQTDVVTVDNAGDSNYDAQIIYGADSISIKSEIPERNFEITKTDNGLHVKGMYRFQDFDVAYGKDGFTIQGLYPQQKYVVKREA